MNRDFVYNHDRPSVWSRAGGVLNKWLWGLFCCGPPGVACYFCACYERPEDRTDRDTTRIHQATATTERLSRQHRPNAPRGRKSTAEMLSAVRCALSQLQGEPEPNLIVPTNEKPIEPG
ncbi:uncharacterized protein LOC114246993 [Bombyx mandarina]|uniref:Uncharacterized protein n=2 Tax=Bombyx TaxID=7090 RepID=A0A8R2LY79_BOMMO|nr:uncharacterized protein LOC114246993 [Bombyx mandarina]XP_037869406.1 uncharacterized protein LOC105842205 [Bombyx mori]